MKNNVLSFTRYSDNANDVLGSLKSGNMAFPYYDFNKILKIQKVISKINAREYIGTTTVKNNTTLEKLSYDIYGTTDYWDLLLVLNDRNPLFDMPFDYDVVYNSVENYINQYELKFLGRKMTEREKERFRAEYMEKLSRENEVYREIKYIFVDKIYSFKQMLYENDL